MFGETEMVCLFSIALCLFVVTFGKTTGIKSVGSVIW